MLRFKVPSLRTFHISATVTTLALSLVSGVTSHAYASGMPQLNFGDHYVKAQIIWGAFIFSGLYLILRYSALPRVERVLETRKTAIRQNLEEAERAKRLADQSWEELQKTRNTAAAEAQKNVNKVIEEARQKASAQLHSLQEHFNTQIKHTEKELQANRQNIIENMTDLASETTSAFFERLIGENVDRTKIVEKIRSISPAHLQ